MAKNQMNFRMSEDTKNALQKLTEVRAEELKELLGSDSWTMTDQIVSLIWAAYKEKFNENK